MSVRLADLTDADVAAERARFPRAFSRTGGDSAKLWLLWGLGAALTDLLPVPVRFLLRRLPARHVEVRPGGRVAQLFPPTGYENLPLVPEGHGRDHRHGVPRHAAGRGVRVSAELPRLEEHDAIAAGAVRHTALCRSAALIRLPDLGAHLRARDRPRPARRHHGDRHRRDRHLHQAVFGSDREPRPQAESTASPRPAATGCSASASACCRRCCR